MYNCITTDLSDNILIITLNRPQQLNSLSIELLEELEKLLIDVKSDPSISGIIITGAGKAFCAGADIKKLLELDAASGQQFAKYGQYVFNKLEQLGKPSIAAINGMAYGGGLELAMATNIRFAVPDIRLGQPEVKLGIIPGFGGTQRLARLIGKGRAMQVCLTGDDLLSEQALDWGLINELVEKDDLLIRAKEILQKILSLAPVAVSAILDSINIGYDLPLVQAQEFEANLFGITCGTADKQEGVSAFLEKRKANFSGK